MSQHPSLAAVSTVASSNLSHSDDDVPSMSRALLVVQMFTSATTVIGTFVFVGWMIARDFTPSEALLTAGGCVAIACGVGATASVTRKVAKRFAAGLRATVS